MFSTRGLFQSLACPRPDCTRSAFCPFSHASGAAPRTPLIATPDAVRTPPIPTPDTAPPPTVPAKRPSASTSHLEPPPQRIRTASAPKPVPRAESSVRPLPPSRSFPHLHSLVRCARPQSQCRAVTGRPPCPPGSRPPPPSQFLLTSPHRPCSRASMTTFSSCTRTSCLQAQPSPPSMPCARKNRCARTRQNSLIAMCAPPSSLSPVSSLASGSHKLDRFPKETPHPHFHLSSLCRYRSRYRSAHRGTQQTRRTSSHPFHPHPPSHDHRYHATVELYN